MELKNFEINSPEKQKGFKEMESSFNKRKELYEKMSQKVEEKEIAREVIDNIFEKEKHPEFSNIAYQKPVSIFDQEVGQVSNEAEKVLKQLIETAFEKGVKKAIALSYKTSNPYIMDKFHDILVDVFYDKLTQKNKLKNQ